jgi:hypothetical protein
MPATRVMGYVSRLMQKPLELGSKEIAAQDVKDQQAAAGVSAAGLQQVDLQNEDLKGSAVGTQAEQSQKIKETNQALKDAARERNRNNLVQTMEAQKAGEAALAEDAAQAAVAHAAEGAMFTETHRRRETNRLLRPTRPHHLPRPQVAPLLPVTYLSRYRRPSNE